MQGVPEFGKGMAQKRVTLSKVISFNEVVTLELKEVGSKYILWMVDSFTRFIQGKLMNNKKADTIVKALNNS